MSAANLSRVRLGRMHDVMARYVERGEFPGLVTLVSRRGEVHVDALGTQAMGGAPMRRDTLFRITSMTKPITAVAAMILVEECRLRLDEPVERLLPELADRKVLKRLDGPLDDTEPARRSITVRDVLTFRWGFGMIMEPSSTYPIQQAMNAQRLGIGPPTPATPHSPDEWLRRFATLPLMYQPGERWMYDTGAQLLGVLIARASGQSLEAFLRERIFEPLGMKDTGFSVPAEKRERLSSCYAFDPGTGALKLEDGVDGQWSRPPAFPNGANGLVSTADDFLAFGQMLLNGGKLGRERILSRPSVELMTTDQLTPEQKAVSGFFPGFWDNQGWGFGLSMVTRRDGVAAVPGRFGWDGGFGTLWYSDPKEELVAILMTQRLMFPEFSSAFLDFGTLVYQAIDD
ncbi:beta-lactamase family protein [Pyxidicoccus fallax]|uniref:Beta-lactamase family protein n=1 Tax=Pyxidicoccus fallax TaxID=394095 RepID=A0A848L5D0_9BACT|nr:serine hydrolase domain-containing protein [Pyxidicoccus fallax]NMO13687.1 beta-lactamase family protein [Pyxidicoccus fallax]NPC76825.1 beta-lactamase family protein [Pyxidicoccus fallax]